MTFWALSVDFGTSNTVAVLRRPDGRTESVLFDGSPLLPSAVYAEPGGTLLTGRDALHSARIAPERFEPNPKLRIDDGTVLLGGERPVAELFAAVLGRVAVEARRVATGPIDRVVLSHPAGWAGHRRGVLRDAAGAAGLAPVLLVAEPVAAAYHFLGVSDGDPAVPVVIYDLGAGTLDVSVVRAGRVLATDGLTDTGGLDVDAALVERLHAGYGGRDPELWERLRHPTDAAAGRARRLLHDDVRTAKEMLSRTAQTFVHIPLLDVEAPIGRDELDAVATPLIDRTVRLTRDTIAGAGVPVPPPGPLYLVGGATRMPLVATLLHRRLRTAPVAADQPELVVAHGALATPDAATGTPAGREPVRPIAVAPVPGPRPADDAARRALYTTVAMRLRARAYQLGAAPVGSASVGSASVGMAAGRSDSAAGAAGRTAPGRGAPAGTGALAGVPAGTGTAGGRGTGSGTGRRPARPGEKGEKGAGSKVAAVIMIVVILALLVLYFTHLAQIRAFVNSG